MFAIGHTLRLVLLLAVLAIAGCDGDDGESTTPAPKPPTSERRGVVLTLDRDSPHAGETLTLTVENRTRTRLEYGVAYRLEHLVDGDWRWVNRDSAFILILKFVEAGQREREQIQLPGDLEPGRYRITKSFTAPAAERQLDASVEFTVSGL